MANESSGYFKSLKILHTALVVGFTMFVIIVFFLVYTKSSPGLNDESLERTFQVVSVVLTALALLIGFRLFRKRLMDVRHSTAATEERLNKYRAAAIGWWAMIEGPGLLAIIFFFLTHSYAFLALAGFHLLLLAIFAPRKENIIMLLNLSSQEVDKLEENG